MNNKCSRALEGQKWSLFYSHLTWGQNFKTLKYKALKLPALCHFSFLKQCQQTLFTVTYTKSLVPCHISLWPGQLLNPMAELFWHWEKTSVGGYHDGQACMHVTHVTCSCPHVTHSLFQGQCQKPGPLCLSPSEVSELLSSFLWPGLHSSGHSPLKNPCQPLEVTPRDHLGITLWVPANSECSVILHLNYSL